MVDQRGNRTFEEIMSQPAVWETTVRELSPRRVDLERFFQQKNYDEVVFIGCGSTHYLSLTASTIYQSLVGARSRALPSSEVLLYPESCLLREGKTLLVAISRSGETTETLQAVQFARENYGADVLAITCYGNSPLANDCSLCLVASAAEETSVAQTRSFSSMLLISQFLASVVSGRSDYWEQVQQAVALAEPVLSQSSSLAAELGPVDTCSKLVYLGSGPLYGLACEAALKMTEISLSRAETYHTLEYRHGPKSTVDGETLIVGLLSEKGRGQQTAVFRDMRDLGARVLAMGPGCGPDDGDYLFEMKSGMRDLSGAVTYMPLLQLLAYHRGMSKGLDPDRPQHLEAVVRLWLQIGEILGQPSRFEEFLQSAVVDFNRWRKWLSPSEMGQEFDELKTSRRRRLIATDGCPLRWDRTRVEASRVQLYADVADLISDPGGFVVDRIAVNMQHYVDAFRLKGSLDALREIDA